MKKLLSIILTVIMAISALVIPSTVSAKETKKVPNTYFAEHGKALNFSKGTITNDCDGKFAYYKNSGKTCTKIEKTSLYVVNSVNGYYVRGNEVIYCYVTSSYSGVLYYNFKTFNLNSKKKNVVFAVSDTSIVDLIGGYGSGIIYSEEFYNRKTKTYSYVVSMRRNNKTTKLFTEKTKRSIEFTIFDGKIFYNNKVYNIATGKKSKFEAKHTYATKDLMYYINKNNNLKSLSQTDMNIRRMISRNVYKYYYSTGHSEVVYSNLNSKKVETFYRSYGTEGRKKLCTIADIYKVTNTKGKINSKNYYVSNSLIYKNKVYFNINLNGKNYVVNVSVNGGKPAVYFTPKVKSHDISMYQFGSKLKCIEIK